MVIFFFKRKDELKSKNVILLYSNNYITFLLHRENYYKIMFLTYSLNDLDILLYLLQALICYFYFLDDPIGLYNSLLVKYFQFI